MDEIKKRPREWCKDNNIYMMDPDGWRGENGRSWFDPITEAEFEKRLSTSTYSQGSQR